MFGELTPVVNAFSYVLLVAVALFQVHLILSDDSDEHLAAHNKTNAKIIAMMNDCVDECKQYITFDRDSGVYQLTPAGRDASQWDIVKVVVHLDNLDREIHYRLNTRKFKWWRFRFRALIQVGNDFQIWESIQRDTLNTRGGITANRHDVSRVV